MSCTISLTVCHTETLKEFFLAASTQRLRSSLTLSLDCRGTPLGNTKSKPVNMRLLANTVLTHDTKNVGYEILLTQDMLLFKPYFYHRERNFPCIVLSRADRGWQLQDAVEKSVETQIREDIAGLKI